MDGANLVENLLEQLTLDEKISLISGANVWETTAIKRLNIPSLKVTDGPNGARGASFFDGTTAACFPACVSLAATFNTSIAEQVGKALGQESCTKGAYVLLGPTVCMHRSPLGGRNFEAFSEDPLLSGILATHYVRGLQSERVGATIKHFLGNEQDTRRFSVNEIISERALREIYLRPFEMVVEDANPWCLMTSYPKINGQHVDTNKVFLQDILRDQWKYEGLVMSDWGSTTNTIDSINAGLDLEMPGPTRWRSATQVKEGISSAQIHEQTINDRAGAVLRLLQKTGKFSDRKETPEEKAVDLPAHRQLIREAGGQGIVLLKNKDNILPIDAEKVKKIALLGPLAKYSAAHGGGSASLNAHYKISPFDAFSSRLRKDVEITYSKGAHIFRVYPDLETGTKDLDSQAGFTAEYWKNDLFQGEPFHKANFPRGAVNTIMDTAVEGKKAVRFTTTYTPPKSGNHYLSYSTMGASKLFINGKLQAEQKNDTKDSMNFLLGVQEEEIFQYSFLEGQQYVIQIDTLAPAEPNGELYLLDGQIAAHLGLIEQEEMEADILAEAVALANESEYAILFVGNNMQWETEGQDMEDMNLPACGSQDRLISAVAKVNPRTIVVNTTGVAVTTPWLSEVAGFMQAWYAGQETGNTIVDVILGEKNPSGKLPISWPREYEHTAVYGNFGLDSYDSRRVEYVEDVYVGYRDFDRNYGTEKEVLFPFGFGLSYTTFAITQPTLAGSITPTADDGIIVSAKVENTGPVQGGEVLQAYLVPPISNKIDRPIKGLIGFSKVFLEPGESKETKISFKKDRVAFWDVAKGKWSVESGTFKLWLSTSSDPVDLKAELDFEVHEAFTFDP